MSLLLSAAVALSGVLPIFAEAELADGNTEITVEQSEEIQAEPVYEYKIAGLGEVYSAFSQSLSPSATYYNYLTDANGVKESAHVVVGDISRGAIVFGAELGSGFGKRGKVSSLKDDPESENRLIAAANADFFSTSTGVPMGIYVANGRYVSSSDGLMGFGVHADGRTVFGTVGDSVSITSGEEIYEVTYFNKYTTVYGAYLLNGDFGEKTRLASGISATEYVIAYDGEIILGESVFGEVTEIRTASESMEIPVGCAVLVVPDLFEKSNTYKTLEVGDKVEIKTTVNEEFAQIISAVGGGDVLLRDGEITDTLTDDSVDTTRHPRTAFGVTADGSYVIAVVDGRRSGYSSGVKLTALAEMMRDLGCTYAINLDGGGSSAIVSFVGGTKVLNQPSDNTERSVPNAVALYENREVASTLHMLDVSCENPLLLCDTST
ncbi:MAG: phosphodiester glycosidase family protein, partial [Clostridia bacterium]|nr:phosphodiester glycosidase family protein [Clostridia bacterium]